MTASLAPQEDQVHFPKVWERHVKPTRTTGKSRKVKLEADRGGLLYAECEVWTRGVFDTMLHEPLKPFGVAFLDGTPDPVGAAVVTAVICHKVGGNPVTTDFIAGKDAASRAMFHRLIADHDLPFAAEAAAMFFTLDTGRSPGSQLLLRQMHLNGSGWGRSVPDGLLADLRHRIAAASDDEYAAVRAALARRRTNAAERLAVALLVPDETEWTDEVCAEHLEHKPSIELRELLATQAVTTAEQLQAIGPPRISPYRLETPALANLIRRLGGAAAPVVIESVRTTHPVAWRRRLHKALAVLPSDEAAAYLADRLHESDARVAATEFAQRFPLRFLRAAASRLPQMGATRTQRLTQLLLSDPGIEAVVPHLDAEARAIVAPLFATPDRVPVADSADLPPLLVAPPWTAGRAKRKAIILEGLVPPPISKAAWVEGEAFDDLLAKAPIVDLRTAQDMARALTRRRSGRDKAIAWFDRFAADAAVLLIPDALGADRAMRRNAETALVSLAARQGTGLVRDAAKHYGEEAVAALEPLLDVDPLDPVGVAIPKPVAWAAPQLLPQVLLVGGERALPPSAVEHLLAVLAIATPEYPDAGVEVVAEACDRASLARFSLALFEQWCNAGAPTSETWAMQQLAHFPDDHTVRVLAPLVAKWPGEHQHQRAVKGLKVLGAIGTETALRAIQTIAGKAKFDAIRWEARVQMDAIAANLGLTAEQLADRLLPDFGLGDQGALTVDYGTRRFTVRFDERLQPFVTDEDDKPRKTLPKPGKNDDAAVAAEAYQRFTTLKKDLRAVAADLVKRLEAAMIDSRKWTLADFREYYVEHALSVHLARRLVWIAEHDGAMTGFRIAEDGSFSDAEDETFTPATESDIRLAHPALLDPEAVRAWSELLADYEILQPFEQMHRPVFAFTEDELATGRLSRFEGGTVEVGPVLGLTKRGWLRAGPRGGGVEPGIKYPLPGSGHLTVMLDPGLYIGHVSALPEQRIVSVCLNRTGDYGVPFAPDGKPLKDIDPVAASEALSGLARLTGDPNGGR